MHGHVTSAAFRRERCILEQHPASCVGDPWAFQVDWPNGALVCQEGACQEVLPDQLSLFHPGAISLQRVLPV